MREDAAFERMVASCALRQTAKKCCFPSSAVLPRPIRPALRTCSSFNSCFAFSWEPPTKVVVRRHQAHGLCLLGLMLVMGCPYGCDWSGRSRHDKKTCQPSRRTKAWEDRRPAPHSFGPRNASTRHSEAAGSRAMSPLSSIAALDPTLGSNSNFLNDVGEVKFAPIGRRLSRRNRSRQRSRRAGSAHCADTQGLQKSP